MQHASTSHEVLDVSHPEIETYLPHGFGEPGRILGLEMYGHVDIACESRPPPLHDGLGTEYIPPAPEAIENGS